VDITSGIKRKSTINNLNNNEKMNTININNKHVHPIAYNDDFNPLRISINSFENLGSFTNRITRINRKILNKSKSVLVPSGERIQESITDMTTIEKSTICKV
jgi:hypothetical protein